MPKQMRDKSGASAQSDQNFNVHLNIAIHLVHCEDSDQSVMGQADLSLH